MNIVISGTQYQNLNSLSGIEVGNAMRIQNVSVNSCYLIDSVIQPEDNATGEQLFNAHYSTLSIATVSSGSKTIWAKARNPDEIVWLSINSSIAIGVNNSESFPRDEAVALGLVTGERRVAVYGNNKVIDTGSVPEDIWPAGGLYPWMTGATSLEVLSSGASDTSAGIGARSIILQGLDTDYNEIQSTVTLNGTTPAAVPIQFFRLNSASIVTAGTSQVNVGDITIRNSGAGTIRGVMPATIGNLRQCVYTVPAGYKLAIYSVLGSINRIDTSDRWATIESWVRVNGVVTQPAEASISASSSFQDNFLPYAVLPEKADTLLRVVAVSGPNTNLTGSIRGKLIKV